MGKKRSGRATGPAAATSGVLLSIMLLPALAATTSAQSNSSARPVPTPSFVAADATPRAARSRRLGEGIDESDYPTPAVIQSVSQYLDRRSSRDATDADLKASWHEFHAWCDAKIRKFASGFRSASVDADDCAQETWVDLLSKLKSFNFDASRGKFSSWLYTLVRNKAADLSRAASRQRANSLDAPSTDAPPASGAPSPLDALAQKLNREKVRDAVAKLRDRVSAESSEIAKLRWLDQMPIAEVKDKLGMTANQLWVREHRLREKLRSALGKGLEEFQSN